MVPCCCFAEGGDGPVVRVGCGVPVIIGEVFSWLLPGSIRNAHGIALSIIDLLKYDKAFM